MELMILVSSFFSRSWMIPPPIVSVIQTLDMEQFSWSPCISVPPRSHRNLRPAPQQSPHGCSLPDFNGEVLVQTPRENPTHKHVHTHTHPCSHLNYRRMRGHMGRYHIKGYGLIQASYVNTHHGSALWCIIILPGPERELCH